MHYSTGYYYAYEREGENIFRHISDLLPNMVSVKTKLIMHDTRRQILHVNSRIK